VPIDKKWSLFTVVSVGVFMATLDSSMVNIALPAIMHEFQSRLHTTEWVVLIYLLTITATLLLWGHLGDRIGKNKIYPRGLLLFAMGSLACAMSHTLTGLITARCGQALGAAMMMATGPALIKQTFPANQLGRCLGLIGIAVSLGLMTGPTLGGILIQFFSWRSIFLVTVPVGFLFFLLSRLVLPATERARTSLHFDWLGGFFWSLALLLFSLTITHATATDWSAPLLGVLLIAALAALAAFIKIETTTPQPLLPLHLFSQPFFTAAVSSAAISFMILFSVIMLTPFYLDRVLGLPSSRIGMIMMAIPLAAMVVAPIAGRLYDQMGAQLLSTAGLLLSTTGLLLLASLTATASPPQIAWRLALMGGGQAMFLSPNSASLLGRVDKRYASSSAALLATARNLGMLLGIAQAGLAFSITFSRATGGLDMKDFTSHQSDAFMLALATAFRVAAAIGLLGALISWRRGKHPEPAANQEGCPPEKRAAAKSGRDIHQGE